MISISGLYSQEMPPRPLTVSMVQDMSFGAFFPGDSGGEIILTPFGLRVSSGSVVLVNLGYPYFEAIFEVDAIPGTVVSLLFTTTVINGNNGGSMLLQTGGSEPASPLVTTAVPPGKTQIHIGGKLTVGNPLANPVGLYSGVFPIIFIQE
ncbi:MAG: DUF4402 domain-containing protein [Bacteroidota bacterium]